MDAQKPNKIGLKGDEKKITYDFKENNILAAILKSFRLTNEGGAKEKKENCYFNFIFALVLLFNYSQPSQKVFRK